MEDVVTNTTNPKTPTITYKSILSEIFGSNSNSNSNSYKKAETSLDTSFDTNFDTNLDSGLTTNEETISKSSLFEKGVFSGKIFRYGLIILILAFLGFNLFDYLGIVTQFFANTFGPIIGAIAKFFGIAVGETTKTVTSVAASGIKTGVDITAGTIEKGADVLEKTLSGGYSKNNIDTSLDVALNKERKKPSNEPMPDESGSSTQANKTAKKSGFCYIGEDRGFRSCVKVNEGDECMSGDIFPTRDICINPNLRE
jgi:hypothetical protein